VESDPANADLAAKLIPKASRSECEMFVKRIDIKHAKQGRHIRVGRYWPLFFWPFQPWQAAGLSSFKSTVGPADSTLSLG
jgi:hypothetical protein